MHAHIGHWQGGFLDYHKGPQDVRVDARAWVVLAPVPSQFFERSKDWRILVNYASEIGVRATASKVASRLRERHRNAKFVALGVGIVAEPAEGGRFGTGVPVLFFAYNHPRCVSRLALNERFFARWDGPVPEEGAVAFYDATDGEGQGLRSEAFLQAAGWSPFAGSDLDPALLAAALDGVAPGVAELLAHTTTTEQLPLPDTELVRERGGAEAPAEGALRGVLFGLGNYAKTVILPYLDPRIKVVQIHEVDPLQIGPVGEGSPGYDTAGEPRGGADYDVYFAAGFHHTHTPLALHALAQGAYAVVEKPLATTLAQAETLEVAVRATRRLFGCFHKRYTQFNTWAREDLGVAPGDPITYHCIIYEVPLPAMHWYRWPTSGSRILSNGCHWIDHFLHLNCYVPVRAFDVREAINGDVIVFIELENDAVFSMTLTDVGSNRLGVRELIELRAGCVTVRATDSTRYHAEGNRRILRRVRISRIDSYRRMYRSISRAVAKGEPGDHPSTLASTTLTLELERQLQAQRSSGAAI